MLQKNNLTDKGVDILLDGLAKNSSIVWLDIGSNNLTKKISKKLWETLSKNQSIVNLILGSREGINRNRLTAEGLIEIDTFLGNNEFIFALDLSSNSIGNVGLGHLMRGVNKNESLEILKIANNDITFEGIESIKNCVRQSRIIELDFSENKLGDSGVSLLINQVNTSVFGYLRKLHLRSVNMSFKGFSNLILALQHNKKITDLDVSHNDVCDKVKMLNLSKPLSCVINLKKLIMAGCNLVNEGCSMVAEAILQGATITELDLSDNNIEDAGFISFSNVPSYTSLLKKLVIKKNFVSVFN